MAQTQCFSKTARLASPKAVGASERTKRRALSKEYAAYAKEAAKALLPGVTADLRLASHLLYLIEVMCYTDSSSTYLLKHIKTT